jgi:serine-type D-Ala-D-Ala carboxypeptidase/endopeptidase (penicillin-binding protein 4)
MGPVVGAPEAFSPVARPAAVGPAAVGSGADSDPRAPVAAPVLVPVAIGSGGAAPTSDGGSASATSGSGSPEPATSPAPTGGSGAEVQAASGSASPVPSPGRSAPTPVTGAPLDPDSVAAALAPLLTGGALGPGRSPAHVIDVATGDVLYAAADDPTVPASTMKLVTAASVLDVLRPDARLRTRVAVVDPDAAIPRVVIIGAGDPSLRSTGAKVGGAGTSLTPASLQELAASTARALAVRGITRVKVRYDSSLFTGPAMHPTWARSFPAAGIVAPVSALVVDQGRRSPGGVSRVADPAAAAGRAFAGELEAAGVTVRGEIKELTAPAGAGTLAYVESPTVGVLVERMLATSDNDYAEILGRMAAAASGEPASFAGVAERAAEVVAGLGVDEAGAQFADASGLSRRNRLAPSTLTGVLAATCVGYGSIHSGLPVAGATGSLATRFRTRDQRPARGVVRAKTGTLTGVSALAGYVSRPDGRLLAFGFVDGSAPGGALAARAALDRAAAALATCDCTAP